MSIVDRIRDGMRRNAPVMLPVIKIGASRGVYQGSNELPSVEVQIMIEGGDKLVLEMNVEHTAKLIQELTYTYRAIIPELKTRNYGGF